MKECEEFAPLLSAFVDGELTEDERAEVLAHVSECEKCRRLLGELTALHAALGELEDEDVPAGFTEGVMAAVRAEKAAKKPQTKKRSAWRRWMPMAACAAIVALAAADGFKTANAPADLENGSPEAEYYCETAPIGESGREGKFLAADYGLPMFELYGAGATDYVLSSGGVKDGDAGFYYAPIAALRDLPEGLGMRQAQVETLALAPADAEWVLVYPNDDSEVPQP